MRDEKGLYYYPEPGNRKVRVYVRLAKNGSVEFRLWESDHPDVWERHQWLSHDVIKMAASLYRKERQTGADPLKLYDLIVAKALLNEDRA